MAPGLAADYQLVFFDQMGVGESDRRGVDDPRYLTFDGFVQDVVAIGRALALRDVVVVGHSAGALVAMLAAIAAPDLFAKTVLLAASPRYLNAPGYYGGLEEPELRNMLRELDANYQAWANTFATMMIGREHASSLSHELLEYAGQTDPRMARRMVEFVFLGDYRAYLPQLQQPMLFIQHVDDPAAPEEVSVYLLRQLPRAALLLLPGAGHCPRLTDPIQVLGAIQQFLKMPALTSG